jgi:hypothetical protein
MFQLSVFYVLMIENKITSHMTPMNAVNYMLHICVIK